MDRSKSMLVADSCSTKRTPSLRSRNKKWINDTVATRDIVKVHWNTLKETLIKSKANDDVGSNRKVDFEYATEKIYAKNYALAKSAAFAQELEDIATSIDSTHSRKSTPSKATSLKESSNTSGVKDSIPRRNAPNINHIAPKSFRYHVVVKHSPTLHQRPDVSESLHQLEANLWRKTLDSMGGLSSQEGLDFKGGLSFKGGLNNMKGLSSMEGLSRMKGCQTRESLQVTPRPLAPYHCDTSSKFSLMPDQAVKKSCVRQSPLPPIRYIDRHYACAAIGKEELPIYKRRQRGLMSLPRSVKNFPMPFTTPHYLPMSTVNVRWPAPGSNKKKFTKPWDLLDEKNLCSFMKSFGPVNLIIKEGSNSSMVVFELMHSAYDARHYADYPLGVTCEWANVKLNNHGHLIKYVDYKLAQDEEWMLSIKAMDPATKKRIFFKSTISCVTSHC